MFACALGECGPQGWLCESALPSRPVLGSAAGLNDLDAAGDRIQRRLLFFLPLPRQLPPQLIAHDGVDRGLQRRSGDPLQLARNNNIFIFIIITHSINNFYIY